MNIDNLIIGNNYRLTKTVDFLSLFNETEKVKVKDINHGSNIVLISLSNSANHIWLSSFYLEEIKPIFENVKKHNYKVNDNSQTIEIKISNFYELESLISFIRNNNKYNLRNIEGTATRDNLISKKIPCFMVISSLSVHLKKRVYLFSESDKKYTKISVKNFCNSVKK